MRQLMPRNKKWNNGQKKNIKPFGGKRPPKNTICKCHLVLMSTGSKHLEDNRLKITLV